MKKIYATILSGALLAAPLFGERTSPCAKKWNDTYQTLNEEQQAWVLENRVSELVKDLDNDGTDDKITTSSRRWLAGCQPKEDWALKENIIKIELSAGPDKLYSWKGGLLESYELRPAIKELRTNETHSNGQRTSKTLKYSDTHGNDKM